jgi:exosortase
MRTDLTLRPLTHNLPFRPQKRSFIPFLLLVGIGVWCWSPLVKLIDLALGNEQFSHVILIPILTSFLLLMNRSTLLTSHSWSPAGGTWVMISGAVCYWLADGISSAQDQLTVEILAFIVMCWGLYLFTFGHESFRINLFALMLLLFMIPLPPILLDAVITFLQHSSADTVEATFSGLGIQAIRKGFTFELSNFIILIEEECSGIRSFFALVITSLVAGHWFLVSGWAKTILVAVVIPLAMIKNAFRIVGLALLGNNVDPAFLLDSVLHRYGGIPLFISSFALLSIITWLLHRIEQRLECALHDGSRAQT